MTQQDVQALAGAFGIATEYYDQRGDHHVVPESTVLAVLQALGVNATSEVGRAAAWDRVTNGPWRRMVPHTVVATAGVPKQVLVHVPHGDPVDVWVELEDGRRVALRQVTHFADPRNIDGRMVGEAAFEIADLPLGWHQLHARCHPG